MPFMIATRNLRTSPDGDETALRLIRGFAVDILQESEGWTQVERGAVSGWVEKGTVGDVSPLEFDTSIDSAAFFRQCWLEGQAYAWLPHYLAGVAKLRSDIKNDATVDGQIGLFRLTLGEWNAARTNPALGLTNFAQNDNTNWGFETAAFAAITARDFDAARSAIQRGPTAAEFYLSQLIGAQAMAATVANPRATIATNLAGVQPNQLPPGGGTPTSIVARYPKYLVNAGPPPTSAAGSAALAAIAADLQVALDAVKEDIIAAGKDVLGTLPAGAQLITNVQQRTTTPAAPGRLPSAPHGPVAGGKPGAGGALGNLIARGEGDYGTFNRGHAGDSARKKINFAAMTIADIMILQALPLGHPERLFAVGKYQVIPDTMRGAVAALGIPTTQNFDPSTQEHVFRNYLIATKRPNVKKFITGQSNNLLGAQFALALEFASVADPNTGRSHYGGMGGNRASITSAEAAMALRDEQLHYKESIENGMTPAAAWNALSG
ncbi:hypothetical protein AOQ72_24745 [Bradyrhizobium yuanmingense]|uniref:Uncharacterized protein n=1 Tax=Bradyrhizobium yuanmingense TaxID=108015 RepID=A0A0R3CIN4_9BRAD|nr:hypothetical protein [Bradyrhizobium yuanmingense]KRP94398.1 hypothetical protein AOQ72_24745 [Bradyrhizobium yuanmingense]